MNCAEAAGQLAALQDDELDATTADALRAHVASCASCSGELGALAQLSRDIRAHVPRHAAPAALHARVQGMLAEAAASEARPGGDRVPAAALAMRGARRRWFAGGALAGALLALALGWTTSELLRHRASDDVATEAVDNHVRATLADRLVAVVSTDRHTVKPWLSSHLDYAAPVFDLPETGFRLEGARIDSLDRRPVAVLVYRYGNHVVDVFVRPQVSAAAGPALVTVRGFNVARAVGTGMEWRAVADVDAAALAPFVERLAHEGAPASAAR